MSTDKYYGYETRRYSADLNDHRIDLDFDKSGIVINQARLFVDGQLIDKANIFYGEKSLTATLPDGTPVEVVVDSGMVGEMRRAQVRLGDGSWQDLQDYK